MLQKNERHVNSFRLLQRAERTPTPAPAPAPARTPKTKVEHNHAQTAIQNPPVRADSLPRSLAAAAAAVQSLQLSGI